MLLSAYSLVRCGELLLYTFFQDGIVHHADAALRDFCAQCIREFLQWSIKQTKEKVCLLITISTILQEMKHNFDKKGAVVLQR